MYAILQPRLQYFSLLVSVNRLYRTLQHKVPWMWLSSWGRGQIYWSSWPHMAWYLLCLCGRFKISDIAPIWLLNNQTLRNYNTFLSRHSGVPCEPGRTTVLLQEGQALMQEACTCHQCVDASTVHHKLSVKELNAINVTSACVVLWQDIGANPNDTKTNKKTYSISFIKQNISKQWLNDT